MLSIRLKTKGDTMIEVLLATVILSMILAGAYSLSSRATRLNQSSYERTRASNLVQEQAEYLKSAQRDDGATWQAILDTALGAEVYWDCRSASTEVFPDSQDHEFYLDGNGSEVVLNNDDSDGNNFKVTDNLYNTWMTKKNDGTDGYLDFYIYTCWEGLGAIGDQVSGTVVRLENR